jgi:hypothetical protein
MTGLSATMTYIFAPVMSGSGRRESLPLRLKWGALLSQCGGNRTSSSARTLAEKLIDRKSSSTRSSRRIDPLPTWEIIPHRSPEAGLSSPQALARRLAAIAERLIDQADTARRR